MTIGLMTRLTDFGNCYHQWYVFLGVVQKWGAHRQSRLTPWQRRPTSSSTFQIPAFVDEKLNFSVLSYSSTLNESQDLSRRSWRDFEFRRLGDRSKKGAFRRRRRRQFGCPFWRWLICRMQHQKIFLRDVTWLLWWLVSLRRFQNTTKKKSNTQDPSIRVSLPRPPSPLTYPFSLSLTYLASDQTAYCLTSPSSCFSFGVFFRDRLTTTTTIWVAKRVNQWTQQQQQQKQKQLISRFI